MTWRSCAPCRRPLAMVRAGKSWILRKHLSVPGLLRQAGYEAPTQRQYTAMIIIIA